MVAEWIKGLLIDNALLIVAGFVALVAVFRVLWTILSPSDPNATGNFFQRNWRNITLLIMFLALLLGGYELYHTKKELANLETDKQTLLESNKRLEESINNVNQMISKFDDFTKDTKKQFGALNKDVAKSNSALSAQLAGIMKDKKPKTCDEAMMYLIQANKEYAK